MLTRRPRTVRESRQLERDEAVVAWRFWRLDASDEGATRLISPYQGVRWEVGEPLIARCLAPQLTPGPSGHRQHAPDEKCRCGIYGGTYRDLRSFIETNLVRPATLPVLGRVSLWGTVIGENASWRASFAAPERLLVPTFLSGAFTIASELEAYHVPVAVLSVRDIFTALHPSGHAPFTPLG